MVLVLSSLCPFTRIETDNPSPKLMIKLTDKQMDKSGGLFIKLMTYYLSDKNYPIDNPIQTNNPSLV